MNISRLRAAGLTDETIVKVMEVKQAEDAERLATRREQTRKRVKNHRSRNACNALHALQGDLLEPIEDARTKLFRVGLITLMSWDMREAKARQMLGRWLKTKDDPEGLLGVIEYARVQNVVDPISYISSMVGAHRNGKRDVASAASSLVDKLRARESEAGLQ